ncbi:MAG TPA: hypothetical protein VFC73_09600 [Syntrophomonadaceae bacterium]|nr:hypothetical protein [Syntrophomonadaceae bacterium]
MFSYIKKEKITAGLVVAFLTFFIALLVSLGSEALVMAMNSVALAILLLLGIIIFGIFFDIIGTAATASSLPPFNAKAAKKIFGAKQAVKINLNADVVANLCNDVIGDIAGILSGAIGAGIVISLKSTIPLFDMVLVSAAMTSIVAALTVGGKAIGKSIAIDNANEIILKAGLILGWFEKLTGIEMFQNRR